MSAELPFSFQLSACRDSAWSDSVAAMMVSLEQLDNKTGKLSFQIFMLEDKRHRGLCMFQKEHTEIRADQMGLELMGEALKITKEQTDWSVWGEMCHMILQVVTYKGCLSANLPHNSEHRGETFRPVSRTQTRNINGQNGVMKIEVVGYA